MRFEVSFSIIMMVVRCFSCADVSIFFLSRCDSLSLLLSSLVTFVEKRGVGDTPNPGRSACTRKRGSWGHPKPRQERLHPKKGELGTPQTPAGAPASLVMLVLRRGALRVA